MAEHTPLAPLLQFCTVSHLFQTPTAALIQVPPPPRLFEWIDTVIDLTTASPQAVTASPEGDGDDGSLLRVALDVARNLVRQHAASSSSLAPVLVTPTCNATFALVPTLHRSPSGRLPPGRCGQHLRAAFRTAPRRLSTCNSAVDAASECGGVTGSGITAGRRLRRGARGCGAEPRVDGGVRL